ncbi:MAG: 30S ribosomal protein S13 [Candidatus Micrarchaeota archaeon]
MGLPKKREKKETKKEIVKTSKHGEKKVEGAVEFRGIVRIAGRDIRGQVQLKRAIYKVVGIGSTLAIAAQRVIERELTIPGETQVGNLSEDQVANVDEILFHLHKYNVPRFLLNSRRGVTNGKDEHFIMSDLDFAFKQSIETEKKLFSWKGYRHAYGQRVRGQRTRNTGRKGMALGVMRKSIIAASASAKASPKGSAGAPAAAKAPSGAAKEVPKAAEKKPAEAKK